MRQDNPEATHKLDLRKVAPAERNVRIFQTFESIHPGTIFVLLDNKDLKDIHEQFNHDFPGRFRWKELQKGPDLWRVKIAKLDGMHFEL
ncbi:MAG TPA: DUF2249 domain-containing protein [Acidobacteriota bacterium]|jgi:uncharacterized protein (DUF2249 family)|nr:DUF2249 domain-containing protein [Acidobacteriota bacterium]